MRASQTSERVRKSSCPRKRGPGEAVSHIFKDGVSFCHCAYVLRISGWSEKVGFLIAVPTKTDVFARFIATREKQILAMVTGMRKEN